MLTLVNTTIQLEAGSWNSFLHDEALTMCVQGDRREVYQLEHFHYDSFSWTLTQETNAYHGRFPITSADFYLLQLQAKDDQIFGMVWSQDPDIPDGELFLKQGESMEGEETLLSQSVALAWFMPRHSWRQPVFDRGFSQSSGTLCNR